MKNVLIQINGKSDGQGQSVLPVIERVLQLQTNIHEIWRLCSCICPIDTVVLVLSSLNICSTVAGLKSTFKGFV